MASEDATAPTPQSSRLEAWARGTTLVTTFLTKAGGLALALNELMIRQNARTPALVVSAFMLAGAQISEGVVLGAIDRFMGRTNGTSK